MWKASRSNRLVLGCTLALGFATSLPVLGAVTTFTFTGEVTAVPVADASDPFGGALLPGAPVTGSYTFDDSGVADAIPADSSTGSYTFGGASDGISFAIDGVSFGPLSPITVSTLDGASDFYGVLSIVGPLFFSMSFFDPSGGALSSDALPLTPSALAGFFGSGASRDFNLIYDDSNDSGLQYQVQAKIDSICVGTDCVVAQSVPEPGSLALLSCGLVVSLLLRRRVST